jgi:hypothetical protein
MAVVNSVSRFDRDDGWRFDHPYQPLVETPSSRDMVAIGYWAW